MKAVGKKYSAVSKAEEKQYLLPEIFPATTKEGNYGQERK